jgi:hypothetical protein
MPVLNVTFDTSRRSAQPKKPTGAGLRKSRFEIIEGANGMVLIDALVPLELAEHLKAATAEYFERTA